MSESTNQGRQTGKMSRKCYTRCYPRRIGKSSFYVIELDVLIQYFAQDDIIIREFIFSLSLKKTSPPSARVAAMRFSLQQNCKTNFIERFLKHPWNYLLNFLETHLTLSLNFLKMSLKLPWKSLKHPWSSHEPPFKVAQNNPQSSLKHL